LPRISNLRTRTKLLGAFLAVAVVIVGVAVVGYLSIRSVNAGTTTLYRDRLLPTQQLGSFNGATASVRDDLYRIVLFPAERADRERDIAAQIASADESLRAYSATYLVPAEVQGLARLKPAWAVYQREVARTIALAEAGNDTQALQSLAAGGSVDSAESTLRGIVTDLIAVQVQVGVDIMQQGDRTFDRATWAMALAGLIGVLLAVGLAIVISRTISVPLSRITGAARDVAEGRLDGRSLADIISRDEIGTLAGTFGFMTDRLRSALSELRQSEERFRQVAESAGDWIWEVDRDGLYTYASPVVSTMLGYSPEDVVGKRSYYDLAAPEVREESKRTLLDALEGSVPLHGFVHSNVHQNGSRTIVETSGVPILDEHGKAVGYRGTDTDVTKRVEAEEELRNSRARFAAVVESAMDAVIVIDGDQRIVIFNNAAEQMFGRTAAEVTGRPLDSLIPERFRDPVRHHIAAFTSPDELSGGVGRRRDIMGLRANGEEFPAEASVSRLESAGARFGTVILRDVSEQKRVNDALRESEERYRRITETITDYVFTVTVEHGAVTGTIHGPGCIAVTGYSPEEFSADPELWMKIVAPEDRAAVTEQARAVLAAERFTAIEHRIVRKDGAERWVRNTPVPQIGPDGTPRAYDGLIQDITERRTLQGELLQAQKMESIGRLAGGVAHDFNNLLTVILGNADLAKMELRDDDPARPNVEEITQAGQRAASLTRQLLAFASRQAIAPTPLDLSAVVADSEKMLRRLLGEDIEFITVLEPSLDSVEADLGQIQQLLVNLAVNARDAMPQGGRLVIETANETVDEDYAATHPQVSPWRYVRLSVADTGVGMSAEVREHLFEPFFTTKEPGKGTGLGLATCHGIVKQIGGQIRVYSEPGQGTTFRILLPATEGSSASFQEAPPTGPTPTGNEKVLVVEDEPAVRRLAVLGLRAQGYSVLEAADTREALEIAASSPRIDLVVSDVVMPGMSGPELIERLRQGSSVARVLLMSGHPEAVILPRDIAARGFAFLPKPFTPERLARKVREVLDSSG
jgi:two-component system cell cycle sensor histidine kinase/response regulator CckA